jgi:hypothetical protein
MDEFDNRIKQHLQEHLKLEFNYDRGIEYRMFLEYEEEQRITHAPISSGIVVLEDVMDVDTADNRFATKDYVEDNFQWKE